MPHLDRPDTADKRPQRGYGPTIPPAVPDEDTPVNADLANAGPVNSDAADAGPAAAAPADAGPAARPEAPAPRPETTPGTRAESAQDTQSSLVARLEAVPATRSGAAPATRPGAAPATRPVASAPARRPAAEPSWGAVVATTVHLWAKRRLDRPWLRALLVLVAAAIIFIAGAVTATLTRGGTTTSDRAGTASAPGGTTRTQGTTSGSATSQGGLGAVPGDSGALAAVASARREAAGWVAKQVNPDEVIGCDPMMCAALEAAHVQANRLFVLAPGQQDPLGSEILLDTATLRSQFGARLERVYAPVSLAAFGSGAARIWVRFSVPNGARAYRAELARDVAARKAAGTEMLRNRAIHASPAARRQLTAGQVDTRLLVTLVTLAHSHPVNIISFGANQAGASPGVPLRSAEITGAPGPGSTPAVSVLTLRSFLSSQQPPYRPSIVAVNTASRRTVLRVGYPAPSLLGLLGTHG